MEYCYHFSKLPDKRLKLQNLEKRFLEILKKSTTLEFQKSYDWYLKRFVWIWWFDDWVSTKVRNKVSTKVSNLVSARNSYNSGCFHPIELKFSGNDPCNFLQWIFEFLASKGIEILKIGWSWAKICKKKAGF